MGLTKPGGPRPGVGILSATGQLQSCPLGDGVTFQGSPTSWEGEQREWGRRKKVCGMDPPIMETHLLVTSMLPVMTVSSHLSTVLCPQMVGASLHVVWKSPGSGHFTDYICYLVFAQSFFFFFKYRDL